ncbi:MAG TPA: hypothetical protein VIM55_11590 [Mucilaginibacter sp.]
MSNNKKRSVNNVLSFYEAIQAGHKPEQYSYQYDEIPNGEYNVFLDFMVKARRLDAIELYCRVQQTGQKFRISYFKDKEQKFDIDYNQVAAISFGSLFSIQVEPNGRDKPTLHRITVLRNGTSTQTELEI